MQYILLQANVPHFIICHLIQFISSKTLEHLYHPCSIMLVKRAADEMMQACNLQQWDVCGSKFLSLALLLNHGFLDVFKENLFLLDGQVHCRKIDYERFSKCCVPVE